MQAELRSRSERGASGVEYAIVVGVVSLVVMIAAALLGVNVQTSLCTAGRALGGTQDCTSAAPADGLSPTASGTPTSAGDAGGSPSGGTTFSGSGTVSGPDPSTPSDPSTTADPGTGSGTDVHTGGSGTSASASPSATAATNSAGTQQFYLATIDQDQKVADLSIRFNIGWQPSNWNNVTYPTTTIVDVTWSPALSVDQVIPGSDGDWTYVLVAPGHLRLIRTGTFDNSGFQPEPEILLKKPTTATSVTATFAVSTANTAALSATASTLSIPYS